MDITAIIGPIFPNMLITLFIPRRTEHNVIIAKTMIQDFYLFRSIDL